VKVELFFFICNVSKNVFLKHAFSGNFCPQELWQNKTVTEKKKKEDVRGI
jgi:hypothetical protein